MPNFRPAIIKLSPSVTWEFEDVSYSPHFHVLNDSLVSHSIRKGSLPFYKVCYKQEVTKFKMHNFSQNWSCEGEKGSSWNRLKCHTRCFHRTWRVLVLTWYMYLILILDETRYFCSDLYQTHLLWKKTTYFRNFSGHSVYYTSAN